MLTETGARIQVNKELELGYLFPKLNPCVAFLGYRVYPGMNPAGPVGKSLTHTTFFTLLSARATPPVSYRPAISSSSSTAHAPTHYCACASTLTRWRNVKIRGIVCWDPAKPCLGRRTDPLQPPLSTGTRSLDQGFYVDSRKPQRCLSGKNWRRLFQLYLPMPFCR